MLRLAGKMAAVPTDRLASKHGSAWQGKYGERAATVLSCAFFIMLGLMFAVNHESRPDQPSLGVECVNVHVT